MVTPQQLMDALMHGDEWLDEIQRLKQENAELRRQLAEMTLSWQSEQSAHVLYMELYTEQMQRKEHR